MSFLLGGPPQNNFTPQGFSSSGLSYTPGSSIGGSTGTLSESPALQANIGGLQSTFAQGANAFGTLAASVGPGFNQLTKAGLNQINTQAKANLSTLNQNLSNRRIQGSSFANAQISQANADTEQQKANYVAQSFLQSLQASSQLTQQQYSMATQQYSTAISQSNIEAGLAAQLTSSNNGIMAQISQANTQLQMQNQQAEGQAIGTLAGAVLGVPMGGGGFTGGGGVNSGAFSPFGSAPSFGGGNIFSGDAYGGSAAAPLAGLTADDYG